MQPSANMIIPFPQVRRRRFVVRTAARLANVSAKTAEKLLAATLRQQADAMARKGIAAPIIAGECWTLEYAIRAELWRHVLVRPDDGAA